SSAFARYLPFLRPVWKRAYINLIPAAFFRSIRDPLAIRRKLEIDRADGAGERLRFAIPIQGQNPGRASLLVEPFGIDQPVSVTGPVRHFEEAACRSQLLFRTGAVRVPDQQS